MSLRVTVQVNVSPSAVETFALHFATAPVSDELQYPPNEWFGSDGQTTPPRARRS